MHSHVSARGNGYGDSRPRFPCTVVRNPDASVDGINPQVAASTECTLDILAENATRNGDAANLAARDRALVGTWDQRCCEMVQVHEDQQWPLLARFQLRQKYAQATLLPQQYDFVNIEK
jgi:hypothetical protein